MVEIECKTCGEIKTYYAKGLCMLCYRREKTSNYYKKMKQENPEKYNKHVKTSLAEFTKRKTCNIIKKHHEDMKDDPEALSTEFIQKIIGVKCND